MLAGGYTQNKETGRLDLFAGEKRPANTIKFIKIIDNKPTFSAFPPPNPSGAPKTG
jgi:hypothetical protein